MPPKKGTEAYSKWRNSEKYNLYIESRTGKNHPMFGRTGEKAPCFGRTGKKHPMFGKKRPDVAERNRQNSGENHPMYNKHHTEKTKQKQSKSQLLVHRGGENHPMFGKRGAEAPNWIDGRTPLYKRIRECFKHRLWRDDVFTRDDFTCQECGDFKGGNLNAHHIKAFADILELNDINTFEQAMACEELWNINNGITLCNKCHKEYHMIFGYK